MLEPLGLEVRVSHYGSEELEALLGGNPACILLDVHAGWPEALTLARHIRGQERTRHTLLLFLGGDAAEQASALQAHALGRADCLFAPLHPDLLRAKVGLLLEFHADCQRAEQEREHLLAKVAEERNNLKALLQQLPVAVYIAEAPSGRLLHASAEAEHLLGYQMDPDPRQQEVLRYGAIHPDGRLYEVEECPIPRVLATGQSLTGEEMLYRCPDGTLRTLQVNAGPIYDDRGRLTAAVSSFIDVTSLKRAEAHQAFLATVSETLASSLDYETTLGRVVQQVVPLLGDGCALDMLEPDGSIRREAVAHSDPDVEEVMWETVRRYPTPPDAPVGPGAVIRTGRTELLPEIPEELLAHYARSAEHLALLRRLNLGATLVVPLHARGRTMGALTFTYKRSGRRYGEEERRLAEDLAHRAALAVDNSRLHREMQLAVRLRDEFLSVASHELKTPLTPLQLKLTALERDLKRRGAGEQDTLLLRHLEMARRQVRKMATLVGELLDVSRISQGRLALDLSETDLSEVLREVAAQFAPEAARAGSELQVEMAGPVLGRWDKLRLEQVVTNLLSNAIRYGAGRPIRARVEQEGPLARLLVKDEGIGIALEAQERIFGKFERAVSERHYGGLGLGLYISRRIVEALGGTIRVQSQPGEGSLFTVELPCAGPPASSPRAADSL
jgi:PAS domain S-box-containing protein